MPDSTPSPALETPRHVLLTGATGFVGQAVLERLLTRTEARLTLVVRDSPSAPAAERMHRVLHKSAFRAWRARVGSAAVDEEIARRVTVLASDLGGLPSVPGMPTDLDLVIHSASSVNFDDPIDAAFATNVAGPAALYEALRQTGAHPHVIHVSTCYVNADRVTVAREQRADHEVDWRAEWAAAAALREKAGTTEATSPVDLVAEGRRRARELGWTDVYTMTKALGERAAEELWAGAGERLTIIRPTIIESALSVPEPGWLDGFKVADPIIAAYAKNRLTGFPGRPETTLDIVPVDLVVDAILAAGTSASAGGGGVDYLHVGTSRRNPLTLKELLRHVEHFYDTADLVDRHGAPVRPRHIRFSDPAVLERRVALAATGLRAAGVVLGVLGTAPPLASRTAPLRDLVARRRHQLTTTTTYFQLYQTYCMSETVYDDSRGAQLMRLANPAVTSGAGPADVNWESYLHDVHLPALTRLIGFRNSPPPPSADQAARPEEGLEVSVQRR